MQLLTTGDGSHTLYSPAFNESYHSRHGALTESKYVFIQQGLEYLNRSPLSVLEVGFGTGLNAWLAIQFAAKHNIGMAYTGYELFPLKEETIEAINYAATDRDSFMQLHRWEWNKTHHTPFGASFLKIQESFLTATLPSTYTICFFDAFSPEKQPELWEPGVFQKIFNALEPGGVLVTYCAKGYVRRNLIAAGFVVERLPGPPGKRQMIRALKPL
ncbi:MAG: tRNA (5-methylaminomethyl-2-thiouridine)(34)-methyltransferase MnmD [Chitinophagales bacterium]